MRFVPLTEAEEKPLQFVPLQPEPTQEVTSPGPLMTPEEMTAPPPVEGSRFGRPQSVFNEVSAQAKQLPTDERYVLSPQFIKTVEGQLNAMPQKARETALASMAKRTDAYGRAAKDIQGRYKAIDQISAPEVRKRFDPRLENQVSRLVTEGDMDPQAAEFFAKRDLRSGVTPQVLPVAAPDVVAELAETERQQVAKELEDAGFLSRVGAEAGSRFRQSALGWAQAGADLVGDEGSSNRFRQLGQVERGRQAGIPQGESIAMKSAQQAIATLAGQAPMIVLGALTGTMAPVLAQAGVETFGQAYAESRASFKDPMEASARAAMMTTAELMFARYGLGDQFKAIRGVINRVPTKELSGYLVSSLVKEIPAEQATTLSQILIDKLPEVGLNPNAGLKDVFDAAAETLRQTLIQTGAMNSGIYGASAAERAYSTRVLPAISQEAALARAIEQDASRSGPTEAALRSASLTGIGKPLYPTPKEKPVQPEAQKPEVAPEQPVEKRIEPTLTFKPLSPETSGRIEPTLEKPAAPPEAPPAVVPGMLTEEDIEQAEPTQDEPNLNLVYARGGPQGEFLDGMTRVAEGSESVVYRRGDEAVKVSEPYSDKSDATYQSRINTALAISRLLGDGSVHVLGYYKSANGTKNPVFSQRWVEGRAATRDEIRAHMALRGFAIWEEGSGSGSDTFVREIDGNTVVARDLDGDNVLVTPKGKTVVIDASLSVEGGEAPSKQSAKQAEPKKTLTPVNVQEASAPDVKPVTPAKTNVAEGVSTPIQIAGSFTTSKGSTYDVTEDGQTIRTKRSPGKGQGETYPPHTALFVKPGDHTEILSDMQGGLGNASVRLGYVLGQTFRPISKAADIPDGATPVVGVFDKTTNQPIGIYLAQTAPAVGLHPVEKLYMPDGMASTHIGNQIVDFKPAAPAAPPAPPAPPRAAPPAPRVSEAGRGPQSKEPEAVQRIEPPVSPTLIGQLSEEDWTGIIGPINGPARPGAVNEPISLDDAIMLKKMVIKTIKDGVKAGKSREQIMAQIEGLTKGGLSNSGAHRINVLLEGASGSMPDALPFTPAGKGPQFKGSVAPTQAAARLPETPTVAPATAPKTFEPAAPQHMDAETPTVNVPVKDLKLSMDVPQFKYGANKKGVVEPLGGKFTTEGVAPIAVWQRNDGSLEVISGRHRLDLAQRSGTETIPAQIYYENQGFTATDAAIKDAELNIRDDQGKVKDYVNYFRESGIDRETAESKGFLARDKGKRGFTIANQGSDELIDALRADQIGDEAAFYIALNAPKDSRLQGVGIKAILDGKSTNVATNMMQAVKALASENDTTVDMFGFDDSAIKEAEEMAKIAQKKQREIQTRLSAITGAAKNPAVAKAEGIDIKDPEAVKKRIDELRQRKTAWDNWSTNPELIAEIREARGVAAPTFELTSESESERRAREEKEAEDKRIEAEKEKEAERKAKADRERDEFTLTGSDREADEAAARGQEDLFAAPKQPEGPKTGDVVRTTPTTGGMEVRTFKTSDGYGTGYYDTDSGNFVNGSITRYTGDDARQRAEALHEEYVDKAIPQEPEEITIQQLQDEYDKAKAALDALGPEPLKPSSEKQYFGSAGKEGASPERVRQYEEQVKKHAAWKRKYSKLKKQEVEASNALFKAKQEADQSVEPRVDLPNEEDSGFIGASDEDTKAIGKLLKPSSIPESEKVTRVFDSPNKSDVVRLEQKTKVFVKGEGYLTLERAKERIQQWKNNARSQGDSNVNSDKIVLSLFDLTGQWSKPWEEAGYQVYRFDIQDDPEIGDVNNFSTEFFNDVFGSFDGQDIYAILAACPCTDFASSGAKHFAAKDRDGRTRESVDLVQQTLATIEYFKPAIWAVENPVGRIERLTGLPPWRLSFNPNHFGDPYTKKTLLWGRFNADLPIAPVEPTEGSKMHRMHGGKSQKTKNARSVTPEGFAYAFFQANNAVDNPVMALSNKYDMMPPAVFEEAVAAGMTGQQVADVVDDPYYFNQDYAEATKDLRAAIKALPPQAPTTRQVNEESDYIEQNAKDAIQAIADGFLVGDMVRFGNIPGVVVGVEGDYVRFRPDAAKSPKAYQRVPSSSLTMVARPDTTDQVSYSKDQDKKFGEEAGQLNANMGNLIQLLGANMYASNLVDVTIKELLQNSFDAVKGAVSSKKLPSLYKSGSIEITIDRAERTISIKDDARGMTPQIVRDAFFTVAGSEKSDLDPSERSGGLGLAKMGFMLGADSLKLDTVRDGVRVTVDTTAKDIANSNFKIVKAPAPKDAHGTTITVKIPENYTDPKTGEEKPIYFPYTSKYIDPINRPLIGPVDVTLNFKSYGDVEKTELPVGNKFPIDDFQSFKVNFDWGSADIFFGKDNKGSSANHRVLSAGVYQFEQSFALSQQEKIPYDIIVNVKPNVDARHPDYPFENSRERFKGRLKNDIESLGSYLAQIARGHEAADLQESFKGIVSMPRLEAGQDIADISKKLKKSFGDQGKQAPAELKPLPKSVTITEDRVVDTQTQRVLVEKKAEKEAPSSFKGDEVKKATDFLIDMKQDPKLPIFHNNTSVDYIEIGSQYGDPERFFAELGSIMVEMKEALSNSDIWGYEILKPENLFFGGVSIDKEYGGVHIKVPYKAVLINPFYDFGAKTLFGVRRFLMQTMIHEIAHTGSMDHGVAHNTQMMKVDQYLADEGMYDYFSDAILDILRRHESTFTAMREAYGKSTTRNVAKSLEKYDKGSAAASARGDTGGDQYESRAVSAGERQSGSEGVSATQAARGQGEVSGRTGAPRSIDSPKFKLWFGDSKVVDETGLPMVMYHGTSRGGFTVFDRLKTLGWRQASMDTVGSWFSNNPSDTGGAGAYAATGGAGGDTIYPVYLSIKNPKKYRTFNDFLRHMHRAAGRPMPESAPGRGSTEELRAELKAEGYDGIEFEQTANESLMQDIKDMEDAVDRAKKEEFSVPSRERQPYTQKRERLEQTLKSMRKELDEFGSSTEFDKQRVFVAFEPEQIKSVFNRGTWSAQRKNILYNIEPSLAEQEGDLIFGSEEIRAERIKEYAKLRAKLARVPKIVAEGKVTPDMQENVARLMQQVRDLNAAIKLTKPRRDSAEKFLAKALTEFDAGNISEDVLQVIQAAYAKHPEILEGLLLSVQASKPMSRVAGQFIPWSRTVRLFKSTGVESPVTIRHELTHSLEQMMTPEQRQAVVQAWGRALQAAIKKNTDEKHQKYFSAVLDFIERPSEMNMQAALDLLPSLSMYQYLNPSEFWAVNAEKMMAAQLGGAWDKFKRGIARLWEGIKKVFGFDNRSDIHKVFKQVMTGSKERISEDMLVNMVSTTSLPLANIQDDKDLLKRYNRPQTPMLDKTPLVTAITNTFSEGKEIFKEALNNPLGAIGSANNTTIDNLTAARMQSVWYGAGLERRDFAKYGGELKNSQGIVVASVALDNAIRSGNIATEVIFRGGLKFDPKLGNFVAVDTDLGMKGVYRAEAAMKKKLGAQAGTDIIQGYLEAKRSISIMNELFDREAAKAAAQDNLKFLRDSGASEEDIAVAKEALAQADKDLESVTKAASSVNMNEDEMQDFAALDQKYPELRDLMDNWNAINKNLLLVWRQVGLLSQGRYETLSAIKDYVPWYRIMRDDEDLHSPDQTAVQSTTRSLTNIGVERKFKKGSPRAIFDFRAKEGQKKFKIQPSTEVSVQVNGQLVPANLVSANAQGEVSLDLDLKENDLVVFETNREIQNIIDNMTRNVMRMTMNGIRQFASNRIVMEYASRNSDGKVMVFPSPEESKGRFNWIANGRKVVVEIKDPLVAAAIYGMDNINLKMWAPLAMVANFVRRGVTLSGVFQIAQVFKDAQTAAMVTGVRNPAALIGGVWKGFLTSLLQPGTKKFGADIEPVVDILKAAGIGGFHSPARTPEAEIKRRIGIMNRNVFSAVIKGLDHIGDAADMAQRVAVYKRVLKETGDETQALYQAANVINFLHHGSSGFSQAAVKLVPFLGAYANSTDVLINSLMGGGLKGMSRVKALRRLAVTTGLLTMTTLLYSMLAGGDPEYEEIDDQTKLRNYIIPGTKIMLPINTSAALIFKAIPELIYNAVTRQGTDNEMDARRIRRALAEVARDSLLGPEPIPAGVKPVLEVAINHSFFTGRPVVPESLKDVEKAEQYLASTSELGKKLSEYLAVGENRLISPIEADHLVRGIFGTAGAMAQWITNSIGEASKLRPEPTPREMPITGKFKRDEVPRGNEDLFYDFRDVVRQKHMTFQKMLDREDYDAADAYLDKHGDVAGMIEYINETEAQLKELNSEIRRVGESKSPDLTPKERREEITDLQRLKQELLEPVKELRREALND